MTSRAIREKHLEVLEIANFDVKRYDGCEDLNAAAWHALLLLRWMVRARLLGPVRRTQSIESGDADIGLNLLLQILARPLGNVNRDVQPVGVPFRYKAVSDVDIYSVWRGRDLFDKMPEAREACEHQDKVLYEAGESVPPLATKSLHSHLLEKGVWSWRHKEVQVFVDLHATDEQIKNQFTEWLVSKRSELAGAGVSAPPTKISAADLRKLHEYRVLAYIDINLLAHHLGLSLSPDQIADKLFPDDRSGGMGDKVRRTIKGMAEWVLTSETLAALEWLGGQEYWRAHTT